MRAAPRSGRSDHVTRPWPAAESPRWLSSTWSASTGGTWRGRQACCRTRSTGSAGAAAGPFWGGAHRAAGGRGASLRGPGGGAPPGPGGGGPRGGPTPGGAGALEARGGRDRAEGGRVGLAGGVAAGGRGDIWQLSDPVIGSDLPTVWLQGGPSEDLEPARQSITGCVKLQGTPAAQDSSTYRAQHMVVFLAETQDPQAASIIAAAAGPGSGSSFAALAVAARALCAVMIARSFVRGTPSIETKASLQRFRPALTAALTC